MIISKEYTVRSALIDDIPVLVDHHCLMCGEVEHFTHVDTNSEAYEKLKVSYRKKLEFELKHSICKSWIVEVNNKALASGTISILSMVPSPIDHTCLAAYVHSMYTVEDFRRNGFAVAILNEMKEYCLSEGITRILLNASNEGRPVYESIGFQPVASIMMLQL